MTKQELETIKSYLDELEKVDLDKYITDNFPNTPLENVMFRECNAIEFKKLYKNITKRFAFLMYSDTAIMLPVYYHSNGNTYNIISIINELKDHVIGGVYKECIFDDVNKIFDYYVQLGNWDRKRIYKIPLSQENIANLSEEIHLIQERLSHENDKLRKLINEYSKSKNANGKQKRRLLQFGELFRKMETYTK